MIDHRSVQRMLAARTLYGGAIDGIVGPKTRLAVAYLLDGVVGSAARAWPVARKWLAAEQVTMLDAGCDVGAIDGLRGPQTDYALEQWQNRLRDLEPAEAEIAHLPTTWPRQKDVAQFFGQVGQNQVLVTPPYQFTLYDTGKKQSRISLHEKVAPSALRVLERVRDHYGEAEIKRLHLDRYFGSLNVRKMRGGNSYSMHSWGIAIDFDASRNQFRWGRDRAAFARPEYEAWWKFWEEEGWVSLGRERNFDWMHVQAVRL